MLPNHLAGGTSRRRSYLKTDNDKFKEYLDDKLNPSFPVDVTQKRTVIKTKCDSFFQMTIWFVIRLC